MFLLCLDAVIAQALVESRELTELEDRSDSTAAPVCKKCNCIASGSTNTMCADITGQCNCKPTACGVKCEKITCDAQGICSTL